MSCPFCEREDVKERIIIQNDLAFAFPTNIPITLGHTIITPKRCVKNLAQLTSEERSAILLLSDQIMKALAETYDAEGFNCAWNQGNLAGQSVQHFHLHIIPRKEGDTGLLGYDPRSMLYRTGDREPSSQGSLMEVTNKIKKSIKNELS